jgi:hypothetical protein
MAGQSLNPAATLSAEQEKVLWKENNYVAKLNGIGVLNTSMKLES